MDGQAKAKGYEVKFAYEGNYEVWKGGSRVRGGFWSEDAAWSWADKWVRFGGG